MKYLYVLQYTITDGYYTDSYVLQPCFLSLDDAITYIKQEYNNTREIKVDDINVVKRLEVNYSDFAFNEIDIIDICKVEVKQ